MASLNAAQQTFAGELAAKTGLDPRVVAGWVASEEPASSKQAPNGANNWLNIGSTDAGFYGASNPAWASPAAAADFTAAWLRGAPAPGFGQASGGIQAIVHSAGQSAANQIAAIQHSGWASGGYPNLPQTVASMSSGGSSLDAATSALSSPFGPEFQIAGDVASTVAGAVNLPNPLAGLSDTGKALADLVKFITSPEWWLRVLECIGGVILIGFGLITLTGQRDTIVSTAAAAAKVAK